MRSPTGPLQRTVLQDRPSETLPGPFRTARHRPFRPGPCAPPPWPGGGGGGHRYGARGQQDEGAEVRLRYAGAAHGAQLLPTESRLRGGGGGGIGVLGGSWCTASAPWQQLVKRR